MKKISENGVLLSKTKNTLRWLVDVLLSTMSLRHSNTMVEDHVLLNLLNDLGEKIRYNALPNII